MEEYKVVQVNKQKKKLGNTYDVRDVWIGKVGNKRIIKYKVRITTYTGYTILTIPDKNENGKELTYLNDYDLRGRFNEIRIPQSLKYMNLGKIKGVERILIDRGNENIYTKDDMILCKPKKHYKILLLVMNKMRNGIVIPNDVKKINFKCFHLIHYLQYLYIPKSLNEIGRKAFKGVISIKFVFLQKGIDASMIAELEEIRNSVKIEKLIYVEGSKEVDLFLREYEGSI